jgi:hypothetical protein
MTHIFSDEFFRALSIAMFSLLVPIGVYVGRMNVRASRREIVLDLERLFQFAKSDGRPIILPSFELVKYKYDPDSNPERTGATISANSIRYYVFSSGDLRPVDIPLLSVRVYAARRQPELLRKPTGLAGTGHLHIPGQLYLDAAISRPTHRKL